MKCVDDINFILNNSWFNYKVQIIGNDDFGEMILEPVINVLGDVADTSELFMRSLQMYNMFTNKKPRQAKIRINPKSERNHTNFEMADAKSFAALEEMKIGVIVRTVLKNLLEDGKVSKEEIEQMQTKVYSKETFDIQYPLLQKTSVTLGKTPARYYAAPVIIYDDKYFLCTEWYEVSANNDRPYLMKWLALHIARNRKI